MTSIPTSLIPFSTRRPIPSGWSSLSLPRGKAVDRFRLERLSRAQHGRGEFRVIGRIGIVLRFQAECLPFAVGDAVLALEGAIQKIARVELDRRLGGPDLHHTPSNRLVHFRGELKSVAVPVD